MLGRFSGRVRVAVTVHEVTLRPKLLFDRKPHADYTIIVYFVLL